MIDVLTGSSGWMCLELWTGRQIERDLVALDFAK